MRVNIPKSAVISISCLFLTAVIPHAAVALHAAVAPQAVEAEIYNSGQDMLSLSRSSHFSSSYGAPTRDVRYTRRRVEIYVADSCPHSQALEEFLNQWNIPYTRYNIRKSAEGKRRHLQLGGGGVPITKIGTRVIRGYRPEELLQALQGRY